MNEADESSMKQLEMLEAMRIKDDRCTAGVNTSKLHAAASQTGSEGCGISLAQKGSSSVGGWYVRVSQRTSNRKLSQLKKRFTPYSTGDLMSEKCGSPRICPRPKQLQQRLQEE
jgi:hypothetical protein